WVAVEYTAGDNTQRMRTGLHAPTPHRAHKHIVAGEHRQRRDWIRGVKVNRRAERSRAFPERIIGTVIEIFAARMPINHGAAERELAHAALEFVGRGLRILHRKVRKARISVGTLLHFLCKEIVRGASSEE